jgi:hypothetical protein
MKIKLPIKKRHISTILMLLLALLFSFVNCGYAWDYGNGRHGTYVLTTNATIDQLYQTVRLPSDPAQYNPTDTNAIPNFQILTITNGATLTANPWNGSTGGTIALKVQGALAIANGSAVSANGLGYRGGSQALVGGQYIEGIQGESYTGSPNTSSGANYGGGGGGGQYGESNGNPIYFGAGGGGYGGNGSSYYNSFYGYGGIGGGTYGTPSLDTVYLGSGGGGNPSGSNPNGGNGGGAIVIDAGNIQLNGQIQANGNNGGGGGSGGSIRLRAATALLATNQVSAVGGNGGGDGRIMIGYAESFSGVTTPAAYTLLDTNSDNVTVITNQPAPQIEFSWIECVFQRRCLWFPTLFFQWNFNNAPIPNATNQILVCRTLPSQTLETIQ